MTTIIEFQFFKEIGQTVSDNVDGEFQFHTSIIKTPFTGEHIVKRELININGREKSGTL